MHWPLLNLTAGRLVPPASWRTAHWLLICLAAAIDLPGGSGGNVLNCNPKRSFWDQEEWTKDIARENQHVVSKRISTNLVTIITSSAGIYSTSLGAIEETFTFPVLQFHQVRSGLLRENSNQSLADNRRQTSLAFKARLPEMWICTRVESYLLGLKNYLNVFFFYDFDMILLWFCYGFDMVKNMVLLWFQSAISEGYDFQYDFCMVWNCLRKAKLWMSKHTNVKQTNTNMFFWKENVYAF